MPRPSREERVQEALEMFSLTREKVGAQPEITRFLRTVGGREGGVRLLRMSTSPEARKVIEVHDSLPVRTAEMISIEFLCAAAGVPTPQALALIVQEASAQSALEAHMIATAKLPSVVEKTVQVALQSGKEGQAARKMILDHAQFLPVPKSQFIAVKGDMNVDQSRKTQVNVLPPLEAGAKRMADRFNELEAPSPVLALPEPTLVEFVDVEEGEEEEG
jgi:hypothetical protein